MSNILEEAMGEDFVKKYKESLSKSRIKKIELTGETKNQVIEHIKKYFNPDEQNLIFKHNSYMYHIVLAETQEDLQIATTRYGFRVSFKWQGAWLTGWLQEPEAARLEANTPYFLIGKLTQKPYMGRESWSFSVHGLVSMKDVIDFANAKEKQKTEIETKVSEHKG